MKTIKGPAIFLAQFAGDEAPFNSLDGIAGWAAGLGFKGVQIPSWDGRLFDLVRAAESKSYCDDVQGTLDKHGLALTELSTHLQGQLVAVHPAYDTMFDGFAPEAVHGKPDARQAWAVDQLMKAAQASGNLGLTDHVTFSGALAWPYFYPWPQRPAGLVDAALPYDEIRSRIGEAVGDGSSDGDGYAAIDHRDYLTALSAYAVPDIASRKIGLIVAAGTILDGIQPPGTIGGDSLARLIRRAGEDEGIRALVLRIDSPGGGVTACDIMRGERATMGKSLLDVQRDLNPGDTVTITLEFESGISLTVDAEVRTLE